MLPKINGHDDLLRLTDKEREILCQEIREYLVDSVSKTGGHLASNLGIVELTVAIETVFDTMKDRLVFDVGHQSYVHKLLTGRQEDFANLRQFGGISGFPKPNESESDAFVAGHASSSVSIALGMARARTLMKDDYQVVAVLGDGAATGGMIYEGMNDAAMSKEPMVIILNDNEMSIDKNVGGMAWHLSRIRSSGEYLRLKAGYRRILMRTPFGKRFYQLTSKVKNRVKRLVLPSTVFENMGLTYLGPVDGHDLPDLIELLQMARDLRSPVLVHVITRKGHGYRFAEEKPSKFHGIGKFDPETGKTLSGKSKTYSDVFGETMMELAAENPRVCAITAAMPGGTGLLEFREKFPNRLFDVGIAEEHAVSMAGGLAKQGMVPVVAIYSTFLQRGYDQIMQDVALAGQHVVFAIDRAGLVGEDGPTHHGVFDVGFLRQIPGMTVLAPANFEQLKSMLRWAVNECNGPVAVRYPRGSTQYGADSFAGRPEAVVQHTMGEDATVICYGTILNEAMMASRMLIGNGKTDDVSVQVLSLPSPTHYSREELAEKVKGKHVFVIEEVCHGSGISGDIALSLRKAGLDCTVHAIDLGEKFVPHGDMRSLYRLTGIDNGCICNHIREVMIHEN
ncbi:MAG: 1-deoxy-D-xylulose-5-phosphate synthase [Oscillospiraceae bacterium]|nr:1-deoxy-D-xylulose-5-phosphate synthase [Oscillospiraceae bacterium]